MDNNRSVAITERMNVMTDEDVKKNILRASTAMLNACTKAYKEHRCKGCPFDGGYGCDLYGHPIEWKEKIEEAKIKKDGTL